MKKLSNLSAFVASLTDETSARAFAAAAALPFPLGKSGVAASVTGTTSETTLATINVPAGAMGPNGQLRITMLWNYTNSANTKTLRIRLGGTVLITAAPTTTAGLYTQTLIANRNSASSQIIAPNAVGTTNAWGATGTAGGAAALNTANALDITLTAQLALGTETATLDAYLVELIYGA